MTTVDNKIITRLHKLMALARDSGATEAEAELALTKAQELMAEHNLTVAVLEASGGVAEGRERAENSATFRYGWKRDLLNKIAAVNYCHVSLTYTPTKGRGKPLATGYTLVGRASNVASARNMFDYLTATIERLVREAVGGNDRAFTKFAHGFRLGCAGRLGERLTERHEAALAEQERKAEAARAAGATGGALVVMRDYGQQELDLNEDFRLGRAPGTTAARRAEGQRGYEARQQQRAARAAALMAGDSSLTKEVANYVAAGFTREKAEEICRPKTDKQKAKEEARDQRWWESYDARRRARSEKIDWDGVSAGRNAGERVGLDEQVAEKAPLQRIA